MMALNIFPRARTRDSSASWKTNYQRTRKTTAAEMKRKYRAWTWSNKHKNWVYDADYLCILLFLRSPPLRFRIRWNETQQRQKYIIDRKMPEIFMRLNIIFSNIIFFWLCPLAEPNKSNRPTHRRISTSVWLAFDERLSVCAPRRTIPIKTHKIYVFPYLFCYDSSPKKRVEEPFGLFLCFSIHRFMVDASSRPPSIQKLDYIFFLRVNFYAFFRVLCLVYLASDDGSGAVQRLDCMADPYSRSGRVHMEMLDYTHLCMLPCIHTQTMFCACWLNEDIVMAIKAEKRTKQTQSYYTDQPFSHAVGSLSIWTDRIIATGKRMTRVKIEAPFFGSWISFTSFCSERTQTNCEQ